MKICVIGAGPAGLAFADRLIKIAPNASIDIYEKSDYIGGISKTVRYKGNRIDIGGHRFFSKSDEVMSWWAEKFPIDSSSISDDELITYQNQSRSIDGFKLASEEDKIQGRVMLLRKRKSRILYGGNLYDYPLKLNTNTIKNIGLHDMCVVGLSYLQSKLNRSKPENLEEFIISRFGSKLYEMFFESYTEKVWGRKPVEISADWGAQRIKGLSIRKVLIDILKKLNSKKDVSTISQKNTETSLIERFLYPKLGPGQMWEEVAKDLQCKGVTIHMKHKVEKLSFKEGSNLIGAIAGTDCSTNKRFHNNYDYVISTMPICDLVTGLEGVKPSFIDNDLNRVAENLPYRDFITVGVLLNKLNGPKGETLDDTWIYIQEAGVKVGRLQIFNNWSPHLVEDPSKIWVGLEYFCNEGDDLWNLSDQEIIKLAVDELIQLNLIQHENYEDATVLREPKTYPAYFDSYEEFDKVTNSFDKLPNLFLIGRNGMHKYNNQDHSMLSAFRAAELVASQRTDAHSKSELWKINAEQEYHEEKK